MKIYLDLDGVLTSFVSSACAYFGVSYDAILPRWQAGSWDMSHALGITELDFYDKIDSFGSEFWANLQSFPWTDDLWNFCEELAPTYILTAPTHDPNCLKGKLEWLHKRKGNNFSNYIMTQKKFLLARWDVCLIDDRDDIVNEFIKEGGNGIVFPQYTNSRFREREHAFEIVKEEIEKWYEVMRHEYFVRGIK